MPVLPSIALVGAHYAGSDRGLASDLLAARSCGAVGRAVATAIVAASHGVVTDQTEVPVDTVRSQLEHLDATHDLAGAKIGVLATARTVEAVMTWAKRLSGPVVLDAVASGPSGETVLDARGIDALSERLGVADLVTVSRRDAELFTGGEIASLDDAQVAAQRFHNRGARAVVIRCGSLPYRFYDAADDPGGDGAPTTMSLDLAYDGSDFALFEGPLVPGSSALGASSLFAITALTSFMAGATLDEALQSAKRRATDAHRDTRDSTSGPVFDFSSLAPRDP